MEDMTKPEVAMRWKLQIVNDFILQHTMIMFYACAANKIAPGDIKDLLSLSHLYYYKNEYITAVLS